MGSHVRPTINRSPRTKSRTGGAAFASLNRRPLRRRLLTVPRICLRSAMLAASPVRHTNSMRSAGPRRLRRGETCLASPTVWTDATFAAGPTSVCHRDDCGGLGVSRCAGRACQAGEDRGLQAEWRRRAVAIPMEMSIAPDWSKTRIRLFGAETFFVSSAM